MAHKWNWKIRAQAYDEHIRMLEQAKWEKRQAELREQEWDISSQMLTVAQRTLESVLASSGDSKDDSSRVQPKLRIKAGDVTRFAQTGSKLGRLAADLNPEGEQSVNVRIQIEETRRRRWSEVQESLTEVVEDGEFEDETVEPHVSENSDEEE